MTHFYPFFSLRIRLILLVLLALIPALAIMLYTAAETRQREAERVEDEALTLVRLLSANQESTIEGARQLLIAVTQLRDRFGSGLPWTPKQVVLEVQDDGRGFEAPQRWIELARQGELGLVETLERAEAIGGQMKVVSAPG